MKTTVREPLQFEVLASVQGFTEGPVVTSDGTVLASTSTEAGSSLGSGSSHG